MLPYLKKMITDNLLSKAYAIRPELLGDNTPLAWSNLGQWSTSLNYVEAAQALAMSIGQALDLQPTDHVLDMGCGYGASLKLWHQQFAIQHMSGLEMQHHCCEVILKQHLSYVDKVYPQSLFFDKPAQAGHFDVVLSVDCAYHYQLERYLNAITQWLKPNGRIGFHTLIKSAHFEQLEPILQKRLQRILAYAHISHQHLYTQEKCQMILNEQGYQDIKILDLTVPVLKGFADYIDYLSQEKSWMAHSYAQKIAKFKILATAKLCRTLEQSNAIHYVQVVAKKIDI